MIISSDVFKGSAKTKVGKSWFTPLNFNFPDFVEKRFLWCSRAVYGFTFIPLACSFMFLLLSQLFSKRSSRRKRERNVSLVNNSWVSTWHSLRRYLLIVRGTFWWLREPVNSSISLLQYPSRKSKLYVKNYNSRWDSHVLIFQLLITINYCISIWFHQRSNNDVSCLKNSWEKRLKMLLNSGMVRNISFVLETEFFSLFAND